MKELLLFVKHPYTAIIIATLWLGTAALIGIDRKLPITKMVLINMVASLVMATVGFKTKKES